MADSQPAVRPFFLNARRRTEVIAHRGGGGEWPGETVFAFERAERAGADVLEMDAHSTADGELVLMHNPTVEKTTDGGGWIKDLTLAQIKQLDAGYTWTADGGATYPFRGRGITVPTLREVFERFSHMRINLEIKQKSPSIARAVCRTIREFGMGERVLVASFWGEPLREFRAACPEVATSASALEILRFLAGYKVGSRYRPDADAIQVRAHLPVAPVKVITRGLVNHARSLRLPVHGWTVNDAAEMERLIEIGADGVITDFPSTMLALPTLPPPNNPSSPPTP